MASSEIINDHIARPSGVGPDVSSPSLRKIMHQGIYLPVVQNNVSFELAALLPDVARVQGAR